MTFADPSKALQEYHRVLRPGGVCAFTTWGSIPWLGDMKAAMQSIPGLPDLPAEMDVPNIFSKVKIWHDPAGVHDFTTQHGFVNVQSNLVFATSVLSDAEEMRTTLKPVLTLMTRFFWTQEQRDALDNPTIHDRIFAWFERRLAGGLMEWEWSTVVTTCNKPM